METNLEEKLLKLIPGLSKVEMPGVAKILKEVTILKSHDEICKIWEEKCSELKMKSNDVYSDVFKNIRHSKHCLLPCVSEQVRNKINGDIRKSGISLEIGNTLYDWGFTSIRKIFDDTENWESGHEMRGDFCEILGDKKYHELNTFLFDLKAKKLQKV